MDLGTPLRNVVGGASAKALGEALDLRTVEDLLRHYPRRYIERGQLTDLRDLVPGEHVTVLAEIKQVTSRPMRNRRGSFTKVEVTDGSGSLVLTFFNLRNWSVARLQPGVVGLFSGKVERFQRELQLTHPDHKLLPADDAGQAVELTEELSRPLLAVYPATERLSSWAIGGAVRVVLDQLGEVPDPVPDEVLIDQRLLSLPGALRLIHRPQDHDEVRRARRRLKFEEAFVLQTELARRRVVARGLAAVPRLHRPGGLLDAFDAQLPFTLTGGQVAAGAEIAADLARSTPMQRLLQGEVGAGKTLVALRAMLTVVDRGGQAVLLAPTEVLAQQHVRSINALLGPLAERGLLGGSDVGTRVALVTGSQRTGTRRQVLMDTFTGDAGIVVGTHALLEDPVQFLDLGLVVVDEQHRFGVEQRAALSTKGTQGTRPHVLVMTATPIPRSVAMTVFGDLETSTITELPAGRAKVLTHVVPATEKPAYLDRVWDRIREEAAAGHQAYVVCPRIGGDGAEDQPEEVVLVDGTVRRRTLAVLDVAEQLRTGPLAGLRLDVLHGRLAADAKEHVMRRFAAGDLDVLVATTVIEVGVDVADAAVMVVMDADRFGVSQLHQLRGRIGRAGVPGVCLLVTDAEPGTPGRARLDAVAATRDGFELSRVDLAQRREGDVLGAAQSGSRTSLRLLSVLRDEAIIVDAREVAGELVAADPELVEHPVLAAAVAALAEEDRAEFLERG